MAKFTINFYANSLHRSVTFKMFIPNDKRTDTGPLPPDMIEDNKPMKTLFLLHGYTGDADNWVPEWLAVKYNFAIVMPNGENSFYLDGLSTGHQFCTFVGKELVEYVQKTFGLAKNPDETYIMGLSMGGFGSFHTAMAYPQTFGKCALLSAAYIIHEVAQMKPGEGNPVANYEYYRECFGEPEKVLDGPNNPEFLIKKLQQEGKKIPEIFMACGTEDFLLTPNRELDKWLTQNNVPHKYFESKGQHDMIFWNEYAQKFVELMFG